MEPQTVEQTQPLLAEPQVNPTAGLVSVRFCILQGAGCCPFFPCCKAKKLDATQIVVPETTTVEQFLRMVSQINGASEPYSIALIDDYQLSNEDYIAPTIRSFENFESPIVVVPKEPPCCLLI
ncbi:hypothetical protein M9Y10_037581 [Tritrichomonas musculus]|uniref:Uncharacterized protein n=1 Tax=Tritrichomonas musculus TaxID=1915356 RepID=A0ABR2GTV7_9EUKA